MATFQRAPVRKVFHAQSSTIAYGKDFFKVFLCVKSARGSRHWFLTQIREFLVNPWKNVNFGVFLHADCADSKVMTGANFHRGAFLWMSFTGGIKFHEDPSIPRA